MKSRLFLMIALIVLPLASFASWKQLPGTATDVASASGALWITGTDNTFGGYKIYRWHHHNWQAVDGGGTAIAVNTFGQPWVINSNGEIFNRTFGSWSKLPGAARDIAIGGNEVWVVGTERTSGGYQIFHWNGVDWEKVDGGAVRIAVSPYGNPWVINDQGSIFAYRNGNWKQMPGSATDIAIGGNGQVWVIGTDARAGGYGVYQWTGGNWRELSDGAGVRIAVDDNGRPIVINSGQQIFKYSGHDSGSGFDANFHISF